MTQNYNPTGVKEYNEWKAFLFDKHKKRLTRVNIKDIGRNRFVLKIKCLAKPVEIKRTPGVKNDVLEYYLLHELGEIMKKEYRNSTYEKLEAMSWTQKKIQIRKADRNSFINSFIHWRALAGPNVLVKPNKTRWGPHNPNSIISHRKKILTFYKKQIKNCPQCRIKIDNRSPLTMLTIDHIIPSSRGREFGMSERDLNNWDNLTFMCARCNSTKASHTMDEIKVIFRKRKTQFKKDYLRLSTQYPENNIYRLTCKNGIKKYKREIK